MPTGRTERMQIRLHLGDRQVIVVPGYITAGGPKEFGEMNFGVAMPDQPPPALHAPLEPALCRPPISPGTVVALIEAVPARAEVLAETIVQVVERSGRRCGVLSLDSQNRLAARFGCVTAPEASVWKQRAADLILDQGTRAILPAPPAESDLEAADVGRALQELQGRAEIVVADLGCRWVPRLFRPVLERAAHIWVAVRAGQWSGAEARLGQAEFSGWTDMARVRLVVLGDSAPVPVHLGVTVAGVLSDPDGRAAHEFVSRELGVVQV